MEISDKAFDVINELIEFNNDRAKCYKEARVRLGNRNDRLAELFGQLAMDSRRCIGDLISLALKYQGNATETRNTVDDLHQYKVNGELTASGDETLSILAECEQMEDAVRQAYKYILDPSFGLGSELADVLHKQQIGMMVAHDLIKGIKDQFSIRIQGLKRFE